MAARLSFSSSSCHTCARCGRPGRLGTCSVVGLGWRRAVVVRPWLIFLVGRTWPCLRSSPFSGGRPAFLLARRRLVDLRSARARFDLFLVGSLHLAQDAPFVLQLGSALLLGVIRLAEMSCCRRDGPRSILRAAAELLVLLYAKRLNFSTRLGAALRCPRGHGTAPRAVARPRNQRAASPVQPQPLPPCTPRTSHA